MAMRLVVGGIHSPLQLRHTPPELLRKICKSVVGEYWHYRLNFLEVDIATDDYKSMQAMRQISKEQRASLQTLHDIHRALCMQLEKRMMGHELSARHIGFSCQYEGGHGWSDHFHTDVAIQDGIQLMNVLLSRIRAFEKENDCEPIINKEVTRMTIWVTDFVDAEFTQYSIFESNLRKDNLRKTVYSLKNKFGFEKIIHAAEITETPVLKDVIGFGSIKDLIK